MENSELIAIESLLRHLAALLVYQTVVQSPAVATFLEVLQALSETHRSPSGDLLALARAYGQWFRALASGQQSWQDYLITRLLEDDNPFTRQAQRSPYPQLSPALIAAAAHDLRILQRLYDCDVQQLSGWVQANCQLAEPLPVWAAPGDRAMPLQALFAATTDWATLVEPLAAHYRQQGSGVFAQFRALRWHLGDLVGVPAPDRTQLTDLIGYGWQQQALVKNTEFLLKGYPALHVLLYGSRGSGKSSLVKALLNQYHDRGLRLIEVAKADLHALPEIGERLRDLPQKFIIFVDDLSFEADDDAYKALKVVLEGNVSARAQNLVVYATSNRRHLIREFFGDRPRPSDADEVHHWDTVQEKLSFSDRFGLTLTFEPADQSLYLAIVQHLAAQAEITLSPDDLEFRALQWATRHNGRSGRTARQFVDFLQADLANLPPGEL